MRNLPAVFFVALAACGGGSDTPVPVDTAPVDNAPPVDDPPPPDSQVLDTSCMANQTAPTTADKMVAASGFANSLDITIGGGGVTPTVAGLDDAPVDICIDDCQDENLLISTTTAAAPCGQTGCDFATGSVDTQGTPLNAYLRVSRKDVITSNIFPSEAIRTSITDVPALALTPNALNAIAFAAGPQSKGNGVLIVRVSDCALVGAEGAVLSVTKGGVTVGNAPFDAGSFDASLAGTFFVLDVEPGVITVGATVNGTTFRAHDVVVFADELSATLVTPGFAAP